MQRNYFDVKVRSSQQGSIRISVSFLPFIVAGLAISLLIAACNGGGDPVSPPPDTLPDTVSFANHITPLFTRYGCLGCHGTNGGLALTTVANIIAGGSHGTAVIVSNPDGSILVQKVRANPPFGSRMPVGGPFLSILEVDMIRRWIEQGARDN